MHFALDCVNDSNTSHWAVGVGLGWQRGVGRALDCIRLLKWLKYFAYLSRAGNGWAMGAEGTHWACCRLLK